jgi:DNA-directed RNA polymerase subunit RPC12/RpoP
MVLVICSECSREVSDLAENCPHCGNPAIAHTSSKTTSTFVKTYKFSALNLIGAIFLWTVYLGIFAGGIYAIYDDLEFNWILGVIVLTVGYIVWSLISAAYKVDLYTDKIVCYRVIGKKEFPLNSIKELEHGQTWIKGNTTVGKLIIMDIDGYESIDRAIKKYMHK